MSMWLSYGKVSPESLELIKKDPNLLEALFFEGDNPPADWDRKADEFGMDYRTYAAIAEGIAEGVEIYDQDGWVAKAVGQDYGTVLAFEFNYGSAFYFSVEEVKIMADGLLEEMGDIFEQDDPENFEDDVPAFFKIAAAEGKAIVGGVN